MCQLKLKMWNLLTCRVKTPQAWLVTMIPKGQLSPRLLLRSMNAHRVCEC